ncbi:MAG: endo-1,4-beta-xylanase [Bacteroidota bacterium]
MKNRHPFIQFFFFLVILAIGLPLYAQNSLRELAAPKKVYIGNIISNPHLNNPASFRNGVANAHLLEEYNTVVLENYMKMSFILPESKPDDIHNISIEEFKATLTTEPIETFLSHEDWANFRKRGHVMIWFNQAPKWLRSSAPTWTGQQIFSFTRKYILTLGQVCGNRVDEWDVINEAISDDAPNGQRQWRQDTWYRRANDGSMTDWGEATYENYIKMLFVWAREAQPEARLYYNDYAIENFNTSVASKNRFMRDQFKALKECGAPIDGIGFQSHFVLSNMVSPSGVINQNFISSVQRSMEDLAASGLEVAITELDIRICNSDRPERFQETAFRTFSEMALRQPNCREILVWGLRDEDNWITSRNDPPFTGCQDAVLVEGANYTPKPAYDGLADAISALPNRDNFGFSPLNPGNGAPADCGGMGSLVPDIISVSEPVAIAPQGQVVITVDYVATGNQDIIAWFQLDNAPFTVYNQAIANAGGSGDGTAEMKLNIPADVPPGNN